MKRDHKEKAATPIAPAELYAILPGIDPAASAARFATDPELHKFPGVDAPEALRRTIEFIPPAVKAYPTGKPAEQIRDFVRISLATRLAQWSDGDAPVTVLEDCLLFSHASEAAFSADPVQAALRKQTLENKRVLDRRLAILRALRAGKQTEAFLAAYRDFEPYDKSFPDLAAARRAYLDESALAHVDAARRVLKAGDYAGAIRQLPPRAVAQSRSQASRGAAGSGAPRNRATLRRVVRRDAAGHRSALARSSAIAAAHSAGRTIRQ
jgi:hypothetical protein